jgi:hypothetical protein
VVGIGGSPPWSTGANKTKSTSPRETSVSSEIILEKPLEMGISSMTRVTLTIAFVDVVGSSLCPS